MGKRKERRLAALNNAGRRIKLDLCAEPSGDFSDSSAHVNGGDDDPTQLLSGLPKSPSASGQEPQNPLLLLGQYSDDELDEESNKRSNSCDVEDFKDDHHDLEPLAEEKDAEIDADLTAQHVEHDLQTDYFAEKTSENLASIDRGAGGAASSIMCVAVDSARQFPDGGSLSMQTQVVSGDDCCWKVVIHEESNQYYYWNTETGETSWELPISLAQKTYNPSYFGSTVCEDAGVVTGGRNDCSLTASADLENSAAVASAASISLDQVAQVNVFQEGIASTLDKDLVVNGCQTERSSKDPSACLLKRYKCLLERLMVLKGYPSHSEQISRYILEVELRLSDIASLSYYGSSLLPFWIHSEKQLKLLEEAIGTEIYCPSVLKQTDVIADSCNENEDQQNLLDESKASACLHDEEEQEKLADESIAAADMNPNIFAGEDVDMEVDMEVEYDLTSANGATGGDGWSSREDEYQLTHPAPLTVGPSLCSCTASSTVGPLLDEECVPPPPPLPPDTDQYPPPPPDEPADPSYFPLPLFADAAQTLPNEEQCQLSYSDSNFQYYGHPADTNGSIYYATLPSTYAETAPVMVNPGEPAAYYNLQDASLLPVPHPEACSISNGALVPEVILPVVGAIGFVSVDVAATSIAAQTCSTSVKEGTSSLMDGADTTAAKHLVPPPKLQSKASRGKKRTVAVMPSLMSNKKVSSLVDKWKAAKEELNEKDEPENAYEMLEKKRQREIEEWRLKQIESGESKDNANFQPLGGDWRERIKRRKAKVMKAAAAQASSEVPCKGKDLSQLSRDLPSGWQAYWDQGSEQVYYGNINTCETTWTRPTN